MKQPFFRKTEVILALIAGVVTIIGFATGWYLFFVLWVPIGLLFRKKD